MLLRRCWRCRYHLRYWFAVTRLVRICKSNPVRLCRGDPVWITLFVLFCRTGHAGTLQISLARRLSHLYYPSCFLSLSLSLCRARARLSPCSFSVFVRSPSFPIPLFLRHFVALHGFPSFLVKSSLTSSLHLWLPLLPLMMAVAAAVWASGIVAGLWQSVEDARNCLIFSLPPSAFWVSGRLGGSRSSGFSECLWGFLWLSIFSRSFLSGPHSQVLPTPFEVCAALLTVFVPLP